MCSWLLQDVNTYNPDTFDLNKDAEAATYWLDCFRDIIKKSCTQAANSQRDDVTAVKRAQQCYDAYISKLNAYEEQQKSKQNNNYILSIRQLLDLMDIELRKNGFIDPWLQQKKLENGAAMAQLRARLQRIDDITNMHARWTELMRGVIAGNMFDSGAKAVDVLLEEKPDFSLNSALTRIQQRPWLIDNFDEFVYIVCAKPYKCAVIFVDNSGVDIVLGILPFARELLRCGTKVILCANSEPSLNDVTAHELKQILAVCTCNELVEACAKQRLLIYANGQNGPCLDMRTLSKEVCEALYLHDVDLLVIEGMGRALHTNFYAKFKCDTLKLLVIKNKWLAERFGGNIFSAICKYEPVR